MPITRIRFKPKPPDKKINTVLKLYYKAYKKARGKILF
jgi:hypothetical protein